jgi:glycosyltransferase involved in cell wall biosynthesis
MKLLIVTQKVDLRDPILGFFHEWLLEFAKHYEQIHVIALQVGSYDLPHHVHVHSLGKEKYPSRILYLKKLYRLMFHLRHEYDQVFVHMNPIYVVLGGVFWKWWHKKIALWYTHKQVDLKLRLATFLANVVFTASPQSFRLPSNKVLVVGHGIPVHQFDHVPLVRSKNEVPTLITIGRISKTKHLFPLLEAVDRLVATKQPVHLTIVGDAVTAADSEYLEKLETFVTTRSLGPSVHFEGGVLPVAIPQYLFGADLFVHLSTTGSLDKAVLEAFAAGTIVISSSEGIWPLFGPYAELLRVAPDVLSVSNKIREVLDLDEEKKAAIRDYFRRVVQDEHSLSGLIERIAANLV